MSIAYIIHCDADRDFVEKTLIRPLPTNGFERWVSSALLQDHKDLKPSEVMPACGVILAVISPSAADSTNVREEIEAGRISPTPMIVVLAHEITTKDQMRLPKEVWLLPLIDLCKPGPAAWRELTALLPVARADGTKLSNVARTIDWNEETFSEALGSVVSRHDHNRAESLVETLTQHIKQRPYPYPANHANTDLAALRRDRQFNLMRRYGDAVIASGTKDEKVRRQYAQSLIEQREYDQALEVLNSIVRESNPDPREVAEAYGLMGRTYKQQYLNDPKAPGSHALLLQAIQAYRSVYDKDPTKVWHGVNMASCIVRAERDGIPGVDIKEAKEVAARLLEEIDRLERSKEIGVWDYASRIEALLVLERYKDAMDAVDQYLCHPEMHAFEVSSTYRQFDQLLQLGQNSSGRPILERLFEAVQLHRGVGFADQPTETFRSSGEAFAAAANVVRPLLIRVSDPQWQPGRVTDLVTESRLGTIVTAQGSDTSVKELLTDPDVIAVNDSTPGGVNECHVSIPFIKVADDYQWSGGTYKERGGRALIAIIDNGIDVLHKAFLDANGKSRIMGIWDQTDSTGPSPASFNYGTYHDKTAIAEYVEKKATPPQLGRNTKGDGHGTHVASIAAGQKIETPGGVVTFAGGVAPEARILFVIADGQSSIGYSKSHVDALLFIDEIASQMELPVVVNVSQGMNAGAHDGKSMLEVAFDAFSEGGRKAGRVIVKSAGNERDNGGHAKVTMAHPNAVDSFRWFREPQALVSERIELWWNSADEFEFQLGNPSNTPPTEWTPWVNNTNQKQSGVFQDGTSYSMEFTRRHVDNGDSQLRIKIGEGLSKVAAGTWELKIHSINIREGGTIHAWIERGVGKPTSFKKHANEEMTLSIPGTAQSVITVGAVEAAIPTQVGDFSSYGPTRDDRKKPEVAAPGIGVKAAKAGTDSDVVAKNGTSMAAPHVTGAIALLLSRMGELGQPWPAASQISSALRQKTINYTSHWDPGQGFGIVDVAALLAAF